MWLKYLTITILFFLIFAIQFGFAPVFSTIGFAPNLLFALFFILTFSEIKSFQSISLFYPAVAGIFSDVFLFPYFGPSIISLLLIAEAIRLLFQFFKEPSSNRIIVNFIISCAVFLALHNIILAIFSEIFNFQFNFSVKLFLTDLPATVFFATVGFFAYETTLRKLRKDNQLKLL